MWQNKLALKGQEPIKHSQEFLLELENSFQINKHKQKNESPKKPIEQKVLFKAPQIELFPETDVEPIKQGQKYSSPQTARASRIQKQPSTLNRLKPNANYSPVTNYYQTFVKLEKQRKQRIDQFSPKYQTTK
ncbi:hypothetical protein pb186bvf_014782 [Paramecium bursaria]